MFLGPVSGDAIPDETTICRYRALFAQKGLDKKLFDSFSIQLREQGILPERGTLVDATIRPSPGHSIPIPARVTRAIMAINAS
ncbi:MAG TPA: transposase [Caldithrix abyssi]|uniref:Transposase n=1 Tax=Caldithrix abyssi TaxID=187145 RepID=A0A7V1PVS6_CALAY|nr:transposase [Caldithrix abyssi]